jgi:hypothetical protein
MDEGVASTAIWRDETIALDLIKEFHGSGGHKIILLWRGRVRPRFLLGAEKEGKGAAKHL